MTLKMTVATAVLSVSFSIFALNERPTASFYVSPAGNDANPATALKPVKTPHRAVELARSLKNDAFKEIVFLDGVYSLDRPIYLGAADYDYTFKAKNKGKAILSGALPVVNWRKDAENPQLLAADLPFEAKELLLYALMVNGARARLSSFPEKGNITCPAELGDGTNYTSLPYDRASFPKDFDISSLDLNSVWATIPQEWETTRTFIASNDTAQGRFILATKTKMPIGKYNIGFKLMNSRLGLVRPGDWMFEQKESRIVYFPREGEKPENVKASISYLVALFDLRSVHNCTIDGLVMEGCLQPFSRGAYSKSALAAAISAKFCRRLHVRNCEIRDSSGGGVYMLKPDRAIIEKNFIHDISSTGINFIDGGAGCCKVMGNVLRNMHSGIYMQTPIIECIGNKVSEIGRSALTLWSCFSVVASNELRNAMLRSRDGGALYGAYDYTLVKDNVVIYDKNSMWPGLYADEGSQHTVFTGNRIEGLFWPMHLHQTYGIVVSNSVFKYDGAMRWSFQGGWHNRFTDNKIYTKNPIVSDRYLPNCVEWARNDVYLKVGNTSQYAFDKKLTLEREKAVPRADLIIPLNGASKHNEKGPVIDGKSSKGEYPIHWKKFVWFNVGGDGYPEPGTQPGNFLIYSHDDKYVYFYIYLKNPMLTPYPGIKNFGDIWGVHDAVKLYFGEKMSVTLFWTGKSHVNGSNYVIPEGDFKVKDSGWWKGAVMEIRLPIEELGFEVEERGKSTAFNAVTYNADHRAYRCVFPPKGKRVQTGRIVIPKEPIMEIK